VTVESLLELKHIVSIVRRNPYDYDAPL